MTHEQHHADLSENEGFGLQISPNSGEEERRRENLREREEHERMMADMAWEGYGVQISPNEGEYERTRDARALRVLSKGEMEPSTWDTDCRSFDDQAKAQQLSVMEEGVSAFTQEPHTS